MEKRFIEFRSAEGGEDSQLFVKNLSEIYQKLSNRMGWNTALEM